MMLSRAAALAPLLALSCGGTPAARPPERGAPPLQAPPSPASNERVVPEAETLVLIDGSEASTDPRVAAVGDAEAKQLLDALFASYLKTEKECPDAPGTLDQALEQRHIVPSVVASARGAFSAARKDEKLYRVSIGECGASHADDFGRAMLVVSRNGAIASREIVSGSSILSRVIDIDADGQDELLLTYGFTNQGIIVQTAKLQRFEQGKLATVRDFGTIREDGCAGFTEEKTAEHAVVKASLKKGQPPEYEVVKKTDACQ